MTYADRTYSDFNVRTTWPVSPLEGYADLDTSREANVRQNDRRLLIRAIKYLPLLVEERGYPLVMSATAIAMAIEFIENLPTNCALPLITADEDGDVVMVWDSGPGRCALTIEGSTLHMVVNPGSNSTHIAPMLYHGGHVPPDLLQYIPRRRS